MIGNEPVFAVEGWIMGIDKAIEAGEVLNGK